MKHTLQKITFALVLAFPFFLNAQGTANNSTFSINFPNPVNGASDLYQFISLVLNNVVMPIGGVIAVLFIILAGFKFVTAQGDTKKITEAKDALLGAAIGTAIILGAWAISLAIKATITQVIGP